jgi:hypothetical protein
MRSPAAGLPRVRSIRQERLRDFGEIQAADDRNTQDQECEARAVDLVQPAGSLDPERQAHERERQEDVIEHKHAEG